MKLTPLPSCDQVKNAWRYTPTTPHFHGMLIFMFNSKLNDRHFLNSICSYFHYDYHFGLLLLFPKELGELSQHTD